MLRSTPLSAHRLIAASSHAAAASHPPPLPLARPHPRQSSSLTLQAHSASFLGSFLPGARSRSCTRIGVGKALQRTQQVTRAASVQAGMSSAEAAATATGAESASTSVLAAMELGNGRPLASVETSGGSVRQMVANLVAQSLAATFPGDLLPGVEPQVAPCNNPKFGDYQCNNAMGIWSRIKGNNTEFKNPNGVGQAIMKNLPESPMVAKTSIAGPGFVNIVLSDEWLAQRVQAVAATGNVAAWAPRLPVQRALVDFSSPNIAKEMHVGHLRSTIIGDTLARMLEYCGVHTLRRNHVGDWGTQFGMLIEYLFEQIPDWETVGEQRIGDLQAFYKAAKKKFDDDAEFKEKAQKAVVKLQGGDPQYRAAWTKICEVSRKEFDAVYQRLGIKLEEKGESFYNPIIPDVLSKLKAAGLVSESEGAQCIWVEGHKVPLIVVKSDGGFNYATTDLSCLWYRLSEEKAEWVVYVTDVGQSQHFDMFFKAARMAGWLPQEAAPPAAAEKPKKEEKPQKGKGKGKPKEEAAAAASAAEGKADDGAAAAEGAAAPVQERPPPPPPPKEILFPGRRVSHVGFGLVLGEDGKRFRTRSSEVVRLVDLLDEAVSRAKQGLVERGREGEWTEEEVNNAAAALGYGAVKYADLKNNRLTNYTFDFDQMLDMKGNTAVYLLYAHARICSIIRKSGKVPTELIQGGAKLKLEHPSERALALDLVRLPEVVEAAVADWIPNMVCEYLYNLSGSFTTFYTNCQVNGSEEEASRLILCEATAVVMRQCFYLLGITPLYRL